MKYYLFFVIILLFVGLVSAYTAPTFLNIPLILDTGYTAPSYTNVPLVLSDVITDTCTYSGSGNWVVDCSDDCEISSEVDLLGNNLSITGTGTFNIQDNVTNFHTIRITGTDTTSRCTVYCTSGCFKYS